ncbi:MAG: fumarate hydratase [Clostridia bacterium]|nr:fumarate hydratase [Clostridia bacterium]
MREVNSEIITDIVAKMCIEANCVIAPEIKAAMESAKETEESEVGKNVLDNLLENARIAKEKMIPICQDTGMAVFFVELGKDVHIVGKNLTDAINDGVKKGYTEGYLRKSVVGDPLIRENTNDNTPAIIYTEQTDGDKIKITYAPKGFGSENKSALKMLNPSDGEQGVIDFVIETVRKAGANPCPPMVVGVGIGGTMDKAAYLAKKALTREITMENENKYYADMEQLLLEKINMLGIGPQGMGGIITALGVNIEVFPTHIAGLPVAVNINCHATRHASVVI